MTPSPQTTPPFTPAALAVLFERDNFRSFQKPGFLSHYWAPLLSVCSGTRRNEIFFLTPEDVLEADGVWCLRIGDRPSARGTAGSVSRHIPLHPLLLKLGLLDFVRDRLQTHAGERLFSEYRAIQEQAGVPFSRAFVQWIKTTVDRLPDEKKHLFADDFHFPSLRALFELEANHSGMSEHIFRMLRKGGDTAPQPLNAVQQRHALHQAATEMARLEIESFFPRLYPYDELMT